MPQIKPTPPTNELRAALIALLSDGAPALGIDPQFPGIPVYGDEEPLNAVAPYIVVDLTADPFPWSASHLWAHRCIIRLVQPVATPDDPSVSLDYNSADVEAYEHNLSSVILGQWLKTGETYNSATRSTYHTLSDLIASAAEDAEIANLVLVDTEQLHRPDCPDAGLPLRAKLPSTEDHELEFDLVLVAALTDTDL